MIDLDFKQEVTAVADFVAAKWEPLENLQSIVELIATDAYVDSRALISRFSANEVLTLLVRKREVLLQGLKTQPYPELSTRTSSFDRGIQTLNSMQRIFNTLQTEGRKIDGNWDFLNMSKKMFWKVCDKFPGFGDFVPLNWEVLKAQTSFPNQKKERAQSADLFQGTLLGSSLSGTLLDRLMTSEIVWAQQNHRRSPALELVGAIYAHFSLRRQALNDQALETDLGTLAASFPTEYFFEGTLMTENPFIQVALNVNPPMFTKDDVEYEAAFAKKLAALTDADKERALSARSGEVEKRYSHIFKYVDSDEPDNTIFAEARKVFPR